MQVKNTTYNLKDLSPPPAGKLGWPWTEASQPLLNQMPDGSEWPRISIVTPSYNQGEFLEETIRSVLLQGYPNLEYMIIDGGSLDNSIEIIKKYERYLAYWVSEPDQGQPDAINKGFKKCTGDIIAFLNSDDTYLPETLSYVAGFLSKHPQYNFLCGQTRFIDEESRPTEGFEELFRVELNDATMTETCHIAQQSTFFRSDVLQKVGYLRESLQYCFDYDFWLRSFLSGSRFASTPKLLSQFRLHHSSKTSSAYNEGKFEQDFIQIYQSALSIRELKISHRRGLRRGLGMASSLLFVHLESTQSTAKAGGTFLSIIRRNPGVLLTKAIWSTLVVSLLPYPIRSTWRCLKKWRSS